MSRQPFRLCLWAGCPVLTTHGYCKSHALAYAQGVQRAIDKVAGRLH